MIQQLSHINGQQAILLLGWWSPWSVALRQFRRDQGAGLVFGVCLPSSNVSLPSRIERGEGLVPGVCMPSSNVSLPSRIERGEGLVPGVCLNSSNVSLPLRIERGEGGFCYTFVYWTGERLVSGVCLPSSHKQRHFGYVSSSCLWVSSTGISAYVYDHLRSRSHFGTVYCLVVGECRHFLPSYLKLHFPRGSYTCPSTDIWATRSFCFNFTSP